MVLGNPQTSFSEMRMLYVDSSLQLFSWTLTPWLKSQKFYLALAVWRTVSLTLNLSKLQVPYHFFFLLFPQNSEKTLYDLCHLW